MKVANTHTCAGKVGIGALGGYTNGVNDEDVTCIGEGRDEGWFEGGAGEGVGEGVGEGSKERKEGGAGREDTRGCIGDGVTDKDVPERDASGNETEGGDPFTRSMEVRRNFALVGEDAGMMSFAEVGSSRKRDHSL